MLLNTQGNATVENSGTYVDSLALLLLTFAFVFLFDDAHLDSAEHAC
jgi:hypothetical protein